MCERVLEQVQLCTKNVLNKEFLYVRVYLQQIFKQHLLWYSGEKTPFCRVLNMQTIILFNNSDACFEWACIGIGKQGFPRSSSAFILNTLYSKNQIRGKKQSQQGAFDSFSFKTLISVHFFFTAANNSTSQKAQETRGARNE